MKSKLKKLAIKVLAPFRRAGLKNKTFTIISNNCWGGVMTRDFGLSYRSPTCGTFFFAKEYLAFCSDLRASMNAELQQIDVTQSKYKEQLLARYGTNVIVGKVLDAEVVLLHYDSFEEAKLKWDRRKARVNWDNLVVKFNDQNLFEEEDYYAFERLPYPNKLFFTANENLKDCACAVYFKEYAQQGYVVDDIKKSRKYFNLKKYLNGIIQNNE